ncbi:MAG: thiamine phosphate synthase [Actinomycetota bacterium]
MRSEKKSIDCSLCAITVDNPTLGRSHNDIAVAAIRGGATMIQFRDKTMDDAIFEKEAERVGDIAKDAGVLFIVNDRVDIAKRCGADGVHVGREDTDIVAARTALGLDAIIGVSVSGREEALAAEAAGADYLGAGPVFETGSKDDAGRPIGLEEMAEICRSVILPVIAIGGITMANAADVMAAGAAGIAVIAAIAEAPDMTLAANDLRGCVERNVAS